MRPLSEPQRELAAKGFARAERIAAKYARVFPGHADDLASAAAWGVVRAASTFDRGRGVDWASWSAFKATQECLRFLKATISKRQAERLAQSVDDLPAKPEIKPNDGIEVMLVGLPPVQQAFCLKVYRDDKTIEEAAVGLGFSPKHGHKINCKALERLRKRLSA